MRMMQEMACLFGSPHPWPLGGPATGQEEPKVPALTWQARQVHTMRPGFLTNVAAC